MTITTADVVRRCVLGGVPFSLRTPTELADAVCDYLASSIAPSQRPVGGESSWSITATVNPRAVTKALRATPAHPLIEPVPGLRVARHIEGGVASYTVVGDDQERRPGAWTLAARGQRLLLSTAAPDLLAHYVLRLIREIIIRRAENRGATLYHGAAAAIAGKVVLVVGPSSAGKTTLLGCILRGAENRGLLLSNDRVLIQDQLVSAVPLPVPLARGTLDTFSELRRLVPEAERVSLTDRFGTRHKATVSAAAFAGAYGASLSPSGTATLLLEPRLTPDDEPTSVRALAAEDARLLLEQACCTPHDGFWRPWFVPRDHSDDELRDRSAQHNHGLAHDLRAVRVTHGVRQNPQQLLTAATTAIEGLL